MPKLEVSWKHRFMRLWVSPTHSYVLGFYNPKIDMDFYVIFGDDRWGISHYDPTERELIGSRTFFSLG